IRLGKIVGAVASSVTPVLAASCNPIGNQSIAVLLVNFGAAMLPAQVTPSYVNGVFFGSGGRSLDGYWREASYGKTSASGSVFGPFTLSSGLTCDQTNAIRDAAIAAADSTVDFRNYGRIFIVMPNSGSCSIGVGSIG